MSCPGGSVSNCRSCEHVEYCDRVVHCHGQCDSCDDYDCENNSVDRKFCSECGKLIEPGSDDENGFEIASMCVECLMSNSEPVEEGMGLCTAEIECCDCNLFNECDIATR